MKKLLFIVILLILGSITLQSCLHVTSDNDITTIQWVKKAKKPIICIKSTVNDYDQREYALIDSAGNAYKTGWISLCLPDTIK